jgi:hypothetical protein
MIKQVLRTEIFESNNNITAVIKDIQIAFSNEDDEFEEEEVDTIVINDVIDILVKNVEQHCNVISFDHSDIETFTAQLSKRLIGLLEILDIRELYIISHLKMNLLGNKNNNYKPLKNARMRFEKLTGMSNNDEAFEVDLIDFPQCIETFFWLQRCDPTTPEYLFFASKKDDFVFYICKYGKVHTIEFEKEILTPEILEKTGWQFINEQCFDTFSESNAIKRQSI